MLSKPARRAAMPIIGCVLALAMALPGIATAVAGQIVVTGSAGKDDVSMLGNGRFVTESPSLTVTIADTGQPAEPCPAQIDPLVNRPTTGYQCEANPTLAYDLRVDLRGGDDVFVVRNDDDNAKGTTATLLGGPGNDTLVALTGANVAISAGDGDDLLGAGGTRAATFDGGLGRDTVDYSEEERAGVTASLTSNTATVVGSVASDGRLDTRTDTFRAIEALSGTRLGDILTGSPARDELQGGPGPDNLSGGDGDDVLGGGSGLDQLNGGNGADTVEGGTGIDSFRLSRGGDTLLTRDGFAERVECGTDRNRVFNDLADAVTDPTNCASIETAAAKHRFDTRLPRKPLSLDGDGTVDVRVKCPRRKPEPCEGRLVLILGEGSGRVLSFRDYDIQPGRRKVLEFQLSPGETADARGETLTLKAREVDDDGRPRRILRQLRLRG
jgi:hypothetical protein